MNRRFDINYKQLFYYLIIAALIIALITINYMYFNNHISSNSETINTYSSLNEENENTREAAVAGLFYPADSSHLSGAVSSYLSSVSQLPPEQRPYIMIVPHAGYRYSAQVAAVAYQKLIPFAKDIKKVILLGPSHYVRFKGAALSDSSAFKTPLGSVKINKRINEKLLQNSLFQYKKNAHAKEHSLEVQLPFLQKVLNKFTIVPIAYGDISSEELADALRPLINKKNTLLVISSDLSHYLDYDTAQTVDTLTAEQIKNNQTINPHQACGATGINTALLLAKTFNYQPRLLDMANSGDANGERDSVVGYASWIFDKKEKPQKKLSPLEQESESLADFARNHGRELLNIAETGLRMAVLENKKFIPSGNDYPNVLFNKGASFVTLRINKKLRGCIGSLTPQQAISLDVAHNVFSAALEDNRFSPLTKKELPLVEISISLLTGYEPIKYNDEADLLKQLKAGTDGVVIRDGNRQGLFLPSVWEDIPDKQDFLKNLKLKAGLTPTYWSNNIKAYRFRVVEIKKGDKKNEN